MRIRALVKWCIAKVFRVSEIWTKLRFRAKLDVSLPDDDGVLVITVVRNEALRLPYFFSYYENLGVSHFIVLDHGSDDDTAAIVDANPKASRVPVTGNFSYKTSWLTAVLEKYGRDRWVLVLDADEILVWPEMETLPFANLLRYLEEGEYDSLDCQLLDMYPKGDISDAGYTRGQDPLEVAPYFDKGAGTRDRVFGVTPLLKKMPLFRFRDGMVLNNGQHVVHGARPAEMRACLLHFKFLQDFKLKNYSTLLLQLVDRSYGRELTSYKKRLESEPALDLWSETSRMYRSPADLIEADIMKAPEDLDQFRDKTFTAAE